MAANEVIERYIAGYHKKQDFFHIAAQQCHDRITRELRHNGIRHIGTFRAKRKDRLRDKLYQRFGAGKAYVTSEDIEADVVDLAGVRIALYFPGQTADALRIIRSVYADAVPIAFPLPEPRRGSHIYNYRFKGYVATHFRAVLGPESLDGDKQHCAGTRVEIQVASMFMHAWAEVEHDLVYKPLTGGELSVDEYSWLDQINGLAIAGDVALEQLQRTMNARIADGGRRFRSHYDLASYIHARVVGDKPDGAEPRMGRADKLLVFLAQFGLDRPWQLDAYLKPLAKGDTRPLVDGIVERILESAASDASTRREAWRRLEEATDVPNPYATEASPENQEATALGIQTRFIRHWVTLDSAARRVLASQPKHSVAAAIDWLDRTMITDGLGIDTQTSSRLIESHQTLTRVRSGNWYGSDEALERDADTVREVIRRLYTNYGDLLNEREDT